MDPLQPLTQVEKEEWGDISANLESLKHLLTYAPYDNLPKIIRKTDPFPHTMLITAENDEIVPYWQPLKYNAKLRTVLSREHPSAHFIITVPDAGHTDYLMDPQARASVLVSELIFILKCLDNAQRLNYN
jgi:oligopeptidase B